MTEDHVDTGFDDPGAVYNPAPEDSVTVGITATVKPPAEPVILKPRDEYNGLTAEGLNALKAMVSLPKDFTAPHMVALARDVAMNIYPIETILSNHKMSNAQYEFLTEHNEFFRNSLAQQANEWQGVKSTQDRLRAEAAAALEEKLPVLASRMGQQSEKLADAVEAAKLFAKIAGVDGDAGGVRRGGEGFTITIDLGADTRITVGTPADAPQGSTAAVVAPLPKDIQGQSQPAPLPHQPQGQSGNREIRQITSREGAVSTGVAIPEG